MKIKGIFFACLLLAAIAVETPMAYGDSCKDCEYTTTTATCVLAEIGGAKNCTELNECVLVGFILVDPEQGYYMPVYDCTPECELEDYCVWV